VKQIVHLGDGPASGNLVICEVVKFHVAEDLFENGIIHPDRIDLVGRNSGNWYTRARGAAMFEVPKPVTKTGMGFDCLPEVLLRSDVLTANNLAQLAGAEVKPERNDIDEFLNRIIDPPPVEISLEAFDRAHLRHDYEAMLRIALALPEEHKAHRTYRCELAARIALEIRDVDFAWRALAVGHAGRFE
jgi:hypothetical protein